VKEEFLSIMAAANWYQSDQDAYGWIFRNYLFLVTSQKYLTKECWRWLEISLYYSYLSMRLLTVCIRILKSAQTEKYLQKCASDGRGFEYDARTTIFYV
jgi:hypothetical protein